MLFNPSIRTKLAGSMGTIAQRVGLLTDAAEELSAVSNQMHASAGQSREHAAGAGAGVEGVSNSVSLVTHSAEELNHVVLEIASSANEAATVASEALRVATDAAAHVGTIGLINDTQSTIAAAVEEQTATTATIRETLVGADDDARRVLGSVSQVEAAAAEASDAAAHTRRSADDLSRLAHELGDVVGAFRY